MFWIFTKFLFSSSSRSSSLPNKLLSPALTPIIPLPRRASTISWYMAAFSRSARDCLPLVVSVLWLFRYVLLAPCLFFSFISSIFAAMFLATLLDEMEGLSSLLEFPLVNGATFASNYDIVKWVGKLNLWLLPWYFWVKSCYRYWSRSFEIDKLLTISLGFGFLVEERSFDVGLVAYAASTMWEILSFLSLSFLSISFLERLSLDRHLPSTCDPLLIIFWIGLFGS